jgi:hypothetical protein
MGSFVSGGYVLAGMTQINPITSPSQELAINTEPSCVAPLPTITVVHAASRATMPDAAQRTSNRVTVGLACVVLMIIMRVSQRDLRPRSVRGIAQHRRAGAKAN